METLPIKTCIEVFLRGFSTTRSFTKPYDVHCLSEGVWMLADRPGGKMPARTTEFVTYGSDSDSVLATIRSQDVERHYLCVLVDNAGQLPGVVAAYKGRGYRYRGSEPLFALKISGRIPYSSFSVRRITSPETAAAVAKVARSKQIPTMYLTEDDSICRLYASFDGDKAIGWVRSIRTHPECAWVSTMYVCPEYRRRGVGRSLLSAMLDDDDRWGVQCSVLLASHTGALLYPHLGYVQQGLLPVFTPVRSRES